MKQTIIIKDLEGKEQKKTFELRDPMHLYLCQKYKASTIKPKKGKGSYTRKQKHKVD